MSVKKKCSMTFFFSFYDIQAHVWFIWGVWEASNDLNCSFVL
jgi:hypothetical protein